MEKSYHSTSPELNWDSDAGWYGQAEFLRTFIHTLGSIQVMTFQEPLGFKHIKPEYVRV